MGIKEKELRENPLYKDIIEEYERKHGDFMKKTDKGKSVAQTLYQIDEQFKELYKELKKPCFLSGDFDFSRLEKPMIKEEASKILKRIKTKLKNDKTTLE